MIKNGSIMTALVAAVMFTVSIITAASADRINPPAESAVAPAHVDKPSDIVPQTDQAIARGTLRRMLSVHAAASKGRSMAPLPGREPVPAPPKAPAARRIALIGAVTRGDGATTCWFRDLDGMAIYPLVPGGDAVDGWRLVSFGKGIAELSIDGVTFQVKEK